MAYYRTCPHCGANLDPGERCDCLESRETWAKDLIAQLTAGEKVQLLEMLKNIPASAANTDGDGVEQIRTTVSTSIVPQDKGGSKNLISAD